MKIERLRDREEIQYYLPRALDRDILYYIAIDQNNNIWAAGSTDTGAGGYFALANYENIPTTTDIIDYITYFNLPMIL